MQILFLAIIGVYLIGNIYVFIRGAQAVNAFPAGAKIALGLLYWASALSFFVGLLIRSLKPPVVLSHLLHETGTGWMVFTLYMILFLLFTDLIRLLFRPYPYNFLLAFSATACLLVYGFYNYRNPQKTELDITINKSFDNGINSLKIVAVSDIHLGDGTNRKALQRYVDMINSENPDVILIGGDLIDNRVEPLYAGRMKEELARLKAPQGIYMVPGNHEYISDIEKSIRFISETPIVLLCDSVLSLPCGIQLIGRDDRMNRSRKTLGELLAGTDPGKPLFLLDHQPYNLKETEKGGIDLQFSGHTHRGQVWPISLLTDYLFEQSYGYRKWGESHIYVSSGLSLWGPPFRIGTDSEIVIFNIKTRSK